MSNQSSYPEWIKDSIVKITGKRHQILVSWVCRIHRSVTRTEFAVMLKSQLDELLEQKIINFNVLMEDFMNLIDENIPFHVAFNLIPNNCIEYLDRKYMSREAFLKEGEINAYAELLNKKGEIDLLREKERELQNELNKLQPVPLCEFIKLCETWNSKR